jgi:type I restriction enzyme S subunit
MALEWREVQLGDVANLITGYPFKSQHYTDDAEAPRLIGGDNIAQGNLRWDSVRRWPLDMTHGLDDYWLEPGDVVLAMDRPWIEAGLKRAAVGPHDVPSLLIQRTSRLRGTDELDTAFLRYVVGSQAFTQYILSVQTGTAVPHISPAQIRAYSFLLPPPPDQRTIAHILGTLDDKIELNRRRNQTLEAMARALFKDWFVDFGPVRAKMEGRDTYLPADLWQLFPDRLDDEGKPEGWRRSTIGGEVTVCGGSTPSTKEPAFWEGGEHHWATPKDLSALTFPVLLDTDRKITDAAIAKISSGLLPVGTVLLSSRAPIGYLAIAEVPTAINQGFIAMKCNGALPNVFVLFWCRENMDVILGNANGSTFQEISKSNFRPIPVIVPPELILNAFRERTGPLYRHIVENERGSRSLAQLRDTLLPKLISGELRIKDAEKFLEDVA